MPAADGLEVLLLHDLVKKIDRAALDLAVRDSNVAQMGPSMTGQAFACLVPAAAKLAHMNLVVGV